MVVRTDDKDKAREAEKLKWAKIERRRQLLEESKQPGQWVAKMTEVIEDLINDYKNDHVITLHCAAYGGSDNNPDFKQLIKDARKRLKISDPAHGWGIFGVHVRAAAYQWREPEQIAPRDWLYGNHLIREFVSATVAPGGVGKSQLVIAETLAMVSGKALLGVPTEQLRVWYINLEDPFEEIERRIQATASHYGLTAEDFADRLFVTSGRDQPLVIAEIEDGETVIRAPLVSALVDEIKDKYIDVVIIDPFVSCHKLPREQQQRHRYGGQGMGWRRLSSRVRHRSGASRPQGRTGNHRRECARRRCVR